MSNILIKGLTFIPDCGKVTIDIYPNGDTFEKKGSERIGYGQSIILPEHGKLIDADALEEELLRSASTSVREWHYAEVAQMIDDAPTILEAST